MEELILGILFTGAVIHIAFKIIDKIDKKIEKQTDLDKWEWENRELLTSAEMGVWLARRELIMHLEEKRKIDFLEFLVNHINPNEMEIYRQMYECSGEKTKGGSE